MSACISPYGELLVGTTSLAVIFFNDATHNFGVLAHVLHEGCCLLLRQVAIMDSLVHRALDCIHLSRLQLRG